MLNNGSSDSTNEQIEILEVINYYLSNKFKEKWRYRFSDRFITYFQLRLLKSITDSRPLKIDTLFTYLHKKCKYSKDQTLDFFTEVDIDLLRPIITGTLTKG